MTSSKSLNTLVFNSKALIPSLTEFEKPHATEYPIAFKWRLAQDIIGILGNSGSGKTTLLKRIAGLKPQIESVLSINAKNINLRKASTNPCVYVGADTPLFEHLNLRENLLLTASRSQWTDAASRTALGLLYDIEPPPLMTLEQVTELCEIEHLLDHHAASLSGGEKQRGQLARALLSGKPILLLDEAFSAMDWGLRTRLHQRFINLTREQTRAIIVVSHSLRELALMTDHLVHIHNGLVLSEGPTFQQVESVQHSQDIVFSALRVRHVRDDIDYDLSVFELEGSKQSGKIYAKKAGYSNLTDRLLVDANTVVLSKQREPLSSMLNQLEARIDSIIETSNLAVVCLDIDGQCLYSHISKKSRFDMELFAGGTIYALFKAV